MNDNKGAFDLWWEWAEKPLDSRKRAGIRSATRCRMTHRNLSIPRQLPLSPMMILPIRVKLANVAAVQGPHDADARDRIIERSFPIPIANDASPSYRIRLWSLFWHGAIKAPARGRRQSLRSPSFRWDRRNRRKPAAPVAPKEQPGVAATPKSTAQKFNARDVLKFVLFVSSPN
jgi:hypothetical protein